MVRGSAFVAIALLSGSAVVNCSSAPESPPLASNSEDSGGGGVKQPTQDSGPGSSTPDATLDATGAPDTGPGVVLDSTTTGPTSVMTINAPSNPLTLLAVPCGGTAAPVTVQVINSSLAPVSLSFYFEQGKNFSADFVDPSTGQSLGSSIATVAENQAVRLVVSQAGVLDVAKNYTDTLQIVVNGGSATANAIAVQEQAQGGTFVFNTTGTENFGSNVTVGSTTTQLIVLTNNGNESASFQLELENDGGTDPYNVVPTNGTVPGGGATATLTATFAPTTPGTWTSMLSLVAPSDAGGTQYCNPPTGGGTLPAPVTLTGVGVPGSTTTGITVQPPNLNFGLVPCGSAPPAPQLITISNTGGDATWKGTFGTTFYSMNQVEADGGVGASIAQNVDTPISHGTSLQLYVTPNPLQLPLTSNSLNDNLTITTTPPDNSPYTIQLTETAEGALLSFNATAIDGTPSGLALTSTQSLTITNSGNLPAYFYTNVVLQHGNDTSITYPTIPGPCTAYTQTNPYPNQCQPVTSGPSPCQQTIGGGLVPYAITSPEFCVNVESTPAGYAGGDAGTPLTSLGPAGGAGASVSVEFESTEYPYVQFSQATANFNIIPCTTPGQCTLADGGSATMILCSSPITNIPMDEPSGACISPGCTQ